MRGGKVFFSLDSEPTFLIATILTLLSNRKPIEGLSVHSGPATSEFFLWA